MKNIIHFLIACFVFPFVQKEVKEKNINIMSTLDTVRYLVLNDKLSLIRFGDGEINILCKRNGPKFQQTTYELYVRLWNVFRSTDDNVLLCLPRYFNCSSINDDLKFVSKNWWKSYIVRRKKFIVEEIPDGRVWGDALITRPYMDCTGDFCQNVFDCFKKLFYKKNIVIVEGSKTRFGVGNDLLDSASSVRRILCPAINAFEKYNEILEACKSVDRPDLFVLCIGPTAKILGLELHSIGYRAIDLGHLDIEYEWFIAKSKTKTAVKNKFVNEAGNNSFADDNSELYLNKYREQVVCEIQ